MTADKSTKTRWRIAVWLEGEQEFDIVPFMFFLLSTNSVQESFRFFFPDPPDALNYTAARQRMTSGRSIFPIMYDAHLFITSEPIPGNLFFVTQGGIALITTSYWERNFSPPSLFEYLLHCIICCILYTLCDGLETHADSTVGCHFDYTRLKSHARIAIARGTICEDHRHVIDSELGPQALEAAITLLSLGWLGNLEAAGSVADKMKDYFKYDLKKDSGYKKRFLERVQSNLDTLWFDFLKEIFKGVVLIVIAFLLFKFGLK